MGKQRLGVSWFLSVSLPLPQSWSCFVKGCFPRVSVCYGRGKIINTAGWCVGFDGNGEVGEGGCGGSRAATRVPGMMLICFQPAAEARAEEQSLLSASPAAGLDSCRQPLL